MEHALDRGGQRPSEPVLMAPGQKVTEQSRVTSSGSGLTRITVNLTRPAAQAMETISDRTGYSKTDVINRALLIYAIIQNIMEEDDGVLHIKHTNGELERVYIV